MFNSGYRNRRATDGRGVIGTQTQYLQTISPAISVSSWSISGSDDTALDPAGGQTVLVNGSGFAVGVSATVGGTQIGAVTIVSSTQLSFTSPANAGGSYSLVVYNVDGSAGILVPGLVYSAVPTWTTAAGTIGSFYETTAISTAVVATADSALTYSLSSGSLPVGSTLYANGVITGTAPVDSSSTTYTFAVTATDAELQDTTRTFTLTVNVDVVTWVTPGTSATITLDGSAYSQALSATDAAGYAVSYTANTLPTGLTLSAGTISGTPTVEGNTSSLLTATAATTGRSATNTVTWVVSLTDTYFKYVTTLLSANASVTTSSFVNDNSTNNAQLTVFGDTRAQNFNPYQIGYYSYYFTGSSYLYLSNQIALGSGDWTIEFWFYTPNSSSATGQNIYEGRPNATNGAYPTIYTQSGTIRYYTQSADRITSGTITPNTWYHIAVVKSSGTTKMWLNGVQAGSNYTDGNTYLSGTTRPLIASYDGSQGMYTGYISNLRVSNIAVYTNTFTPSTTPLLATVNTSWLTGQSNRIVDASINNFTTTISGTVSVSAANPFATVYQASTQYYSGSFNGSTDYLSLATSPTIELTGNFTIECWIYPTSIGTYNMVLGENNGASSDYFAIRSNNTLEFLIFGGATAAWSYTWAANTWYHVAVVRISNALTAYVNGVSLTQSSGTFSTSAACFSVGLLIGRYGNSSTPYSFTGYISNVRLVKGAGIYTGNFVPSTAPLSTTQSAGTNTAAITQPSYSVSFNGSSQYLSVAANSALGLGTGDFTIEYWCYPNSISGTPTLIDFRSSAGDTVISDYLSSGAPVIYINSSNAATSSQALSAGAWAHVAYTRSGTTLRIFVNGVQTASVTNSYNMGSSQPLRIANNIAGSAYFNGYISNLRITKGQALYTSAFTPSTSPLTTTSQSATAANVSLLTCQSTTIIDNSLNLFSITNTGTATVASPNPFATGTVSLLTVQSPTFVDSSYNSLAITAATTTVKPLAQSPFTPVYYSNYFGSSSDYLTVPSNAVYAFGTGDFTIEAWVYLTAYNASFGSQIFGGHNYGVGADMLFVINTTGKLFLQIGNSGVGAITSTSSVSLNTWTHVAIVRSSGTVTPYINGTSAGGAASYTTSVASTLNPGIGSSTNGNSAMSLRGYISNLRVVKGQALYTTTFTPSTTPLTLTSQGATAGNVSLLTCQSPYFIDTSTNSFAIAILGSPRIAGTAPFTQPGGYSATAVTTYGSGYFDGTGDYLTIPASANLSFGTGNFTIEAWAYPTSTGSYRRIFSQYTGAGATQVFLRQNNDNALMFYVISASSVIATITSSSLLVLNTWNHCAISRNGSSFTLYLNGISVGTASSASSLPDTSALTTYISTYDGTNEPWLGYLSDLRVIKGTALYTSAFVPSFTTPLSAVTNTQFLSLQTRGAHNNSDFVDQSSFNNIVTRNGNTTNGTFAPYGANYSNYFDGAGDYLNAASNAAFGFGTGDFTVECWFFQTALGTYRRIWWFGDDNDNTNVNASNQVQFGGASETAITGSTITANTWYHLAYVRSGGSGKLYLNGTQTGSTTASSYNSSARTFYIGATNTGADPFIGYISNVRVVKGIAMYTAAFTPPTAPLTAVPGTSLLTSQNNRLIDVSSNNFAITKTGDVSVQKFSPFSTVVPTTYYSGYFDGNGDYLTVTNSTFTTSGDFTVECWAWVNSAQSGNYGGIFSTRDSGTTAGIAINILNTGYLDFGAYPGGGYTSTATPYNQWFHVAMARSGSSSNNIKCFVNGALVGSITGTSTTSTNSGAAIIGRYYVNGTNQYFLNGYVSNLRYVVGTALYSANFTPSTTPLTAVSGTVLLTCQNNTFIDNSSNYSTITGNGDAKPLTFAPPFATTLYYSNYFDGSGDYLTVSSTANAAFGFGTGDFTVEGWFYGTVDNATDFMIDFRGSVATAPAIFVYTSNQLALYYNGSIRYQPASLTFTFNTWNHVALVRSSGVTKFYLNGTGAATTYTDTNNYPSAACIIGTDAVAGGSSYWTGYMSNIRVTKGQALYTANFTPSTSPLTTTSQGATAANVSLLTCQSPYLIDNSLNIFAITPAGNTAVAATSPFAASTAVTTVSYSPTVFGGSMYFDGTGDYLTGPTSSSILWPGASSFTIDYWMYLPANPTGATYFTHFTYGSTGSVLRVFNTASVSKIEVFSGASVILNPTWPTAAQWNHIALVRNSGTLYIYINGVQSGSVANTTDFNTGTLSIGADAAGGSPMLGYISDFRVVKGVALYTANFFPGASPATPTYTIGTTNYTSNLLLSGTAGGVIDASRTVDFETVGDAKAVQNSPYSGSYYSNLFDGSSAYLSGTTTALNIGTSSFTVEFWIYKNNAWSTSDQYIIDNNVSGGLQIWIITSNGTLRLGRYGVDIILDYSYSTLSAGVWYHMAYTRSGSNLALFVNGTRVATTTSSASFASGGTQNIGRGTGASGYLSGYISNFRVVNGSAVYDPTLTTLTVPTTPLSAVSGTSLLTCQSNKFVDNSSNAFTLTAGGTPKVQTQNPFAVNTGTVYYFNGVSGTGAKIASNPALALGSGDWTIECWAYYSAIGGAGNGTLYEQRDGSNTAVPLIYLSGSTLIYYTGGAARITGNTMVVGQWYYIAVCRSTGNTRMFVNGTQVGSTYVDSTVYVQTPVFLGCDYLTTGNLLNGYIADLRVTKGYARYSSNFTPPTAPYKTN